MAHDQNPQDLRRRQEVADRAKRMAESLATKTDGKKAEEFPREFSAGKQLPTGSHRTVIVSAKTDPRHQALGSAQYVARSKPARFAGPAGSRGTSQAASGVAGG